MNSFLVWVFCFRYYMPRFFFFQAEYAIRDCHVTGFQTCALPISARAEADRIRPAIERCEQTAHARAAELAELIGRAACREIVFIWVVWVGRPRPLLIDAECVLIIWLLARLYVAISVSMVVTVRRF